MLVETGLDVQTSRIVNFGHPSSDIVAVADILKGSGR
jgi:hypothetical protein